MCHDSAQTKCDHVRVIGTSIIRSFITDTFIL